MPSEHGVVVGEFDARKSGQMTVNPGDMLIDLEQVDSVWTLATNFNTQQRGLTQLNIKI